MTQSPSLNELRLVPHTTPPIARASFGWLLASAMVLVAFRYHAFDVPLETDECNYIYFGKRLLAGDRLYTDVWDHQPPGVFVLFAGVIALLGDAPEVFRWTAIAFSLASMALIFAILRRVSGERAACFGAMLFALVSSDPGAAGDGVQRELFMNTLILAAWWSAVPGRTQHHAWRFAPDSERSQTPDCVVILDHGEVHGSGKCYLWDLGSGLLLAAASLLKTVVAAHWMLLALWILVDRHCEQRHGPASELTTRRRYVGKSIALFLAGPLLVWGGTFAYFGATGRWEEFIDAVFRFNVSYSEGSGGFLSRFVGFFTPRRFQFPYVFESALPLWIAGAAATIYLCVRVARRRDRDAALIMLLIFAAFFATCLPSRFWPHYYYLMIPPLVIAIAMGAEATARACGFGIANSEYRMGSKLAGRGISSFTIRYSPFAILLLALLFTEYRSYLSQPPFGITVKRYNSRDFWGRAQGGNVRRVTRPEDTVFVFGNDAEIYYYAQRRCASRYTMITGLADGMPGGEQRRRILIDELRKSPPRLILVLFDQEPFAAWREFLREFYGEPVGWDFHDETRKPIMFVLARKDQPVESIDWDWDRSAVGGWQLGKGR